MRAPNVIEAVVAHNLCCGCGTCVAACANDAIAMRQTPAGFLTAHLPDVSACSSCGACLRVCPGAILTDDHQAIFDTAEPPFLGPILDAYWGWACEGDMRRSGASGGVVTAILEHLLQSGTVEAALVTRWASDDPLRHEPVVVRTAQDLRGTQKSRYCPVALNGMLAELAGFARVAVVGLPCHLHGLTRYARLHGQRFPQTVRIGLFCERTLSVLLAERLIRLAGPGRVTQFDYRHKGNNGWPGDVFVRHEGSEGIFVDRTERMARKEAFTPVRCRVRFDKFNVLADIACGDGYGAPHDPDGVSAVLVRTPRGAVVLREAGQRLRLERIEPDDLLHPHHHEQRKLGCVASVTAFRELRPEAPETLPQACWDAAGPLDPRDVTQARGPLARSMAFEAASTRTEALSIAAKEERRRRARLLRMRVRAAAIRGAKALLRWLPGGAQALRRLSSALRPTASS